MITFGQDLSTDDCSAVTLRKGDGGARPFLVPAGGRSPTWRIACRAGHAMLTAGVYLERALYASG